MKKLLLFITISLIFSSCDNSESSQTLYDTELIKAKRNVSTNRSEIHIKDHSSSFPDTSSTQDKYFRTFTSPELNRALLDKPIDVVYDLLGEPSSTTTFAGELLISYRNDNHSPDQTPGIRIAFRKNKVTEIFF